MLYVNEQARHQPNSTIFVAILCFALGPLMFSVLPLIVSAYIDHLGLTVQQAGYVASADICGLFFGNLLVAWLIRHCSARKIAITAVSLMVVGNMITSAINEFQTLLLCRLLTEIGAGVMMGLSMTYLSRTKNPDRFFGMSIGLQIFITIILLMLTPRLLELVGLSGFFMTISALCLLTISSWLVPLDIHTNDTSPPTLLPLKSKDRKALIGIATILLYWIGIGAFWSYAQILGTTKGLDVQTVANALALSQIAGFVGASATSWASTRWGRLLPVLVASLLQLGCVFFIWQSSGIWLYGILIGIYSFTWNVILIYQLGIVAELDDKGIFTSLSIAAQALGVAIGPALVALMINGDNLEMIYWIAGTTLIASTVMFILNSSNSVATVNDYAINNSS